MKQGTGKDRYYYKAKNGNGLMCLKSPLDDKNYVEIAEEEFNSLKPRPKQLSAAERAKREKLDQIAKLKGNLARTDYEAIKYAEGEMSAEDYEPYKVQRREWRATINQLESEL